MKNEITEIFTIKEYGHIDVKLSEVLHKKGISRNKLAKLVGAKYDVINRYYKNKDIIKVDIDLLAKICCVLNCDISDLLEYRK